MSEHEDPNMEIETLADDDLESVSGGMLAAENSGTGTCTGQNATNSGSGTCTGSGASNTGSGTCTG